VGSSKHDPDLRAHAAQNLIQINEWVAVKEKLLAMSDSDRVAVVAKLVPRLTKDATASEGSAPSRMQSGAKDALFELRAHADDAVREQIDTYLADWLGVNFDDRWTRGRVRGEVIVKHIGRRVAPKLLARARQIIATPPDSEGRIPFMTDDLLKGLAYTGDPEAVGLLLDMAMTDHKEPSLRRRSMAALFVAYVQDPEEPKVDSAALKPHTGRLLGVIRDGSQEGGNINDAFSLLAAAGSPDCIDPLVTLIGEPDDAEAYLWVAVQKGLLCVGAENIAAIVEVMPTQWQYERGILEKYLWKKMYNLEPSHAVAKSCRGLLSSKNWVARITAVECLGKLGKKGDAPALAALANDKASLRGWWGDQSEVPKKDRKKPITLGVVAQEVAKKLEIR
jgi:hypothetical protein